MLDVNRIPALPLRSMGYTIGDVIDWHAARNPERPAVVGSNFAQFCYAELNCHIKKISDQLHKAGIGHSSRVGIVLPRGPEAAVLCISIASHAVSVPLNPNLSSSEFEEDLTRFRLDALVWPSWVDLPEWAVAQKRFLNIFIAKKSGRFLSSVVLEQISEVSSPPQEASKLLPHSVALLLKTSGTTGSGKLVPVTHENLLTLAHKMQQWFGLSVEDRCASILPTHFAQGFKVSTLVPLLLGGSIAVPANPNDVTEWISDLHPTWFWASPTFLQGMVDRYRTGTSHKLEHSLRFVLSGASVLPEIVRAQFEATLKVPILEVYGSSEAGIMSANSAPPAIRKPGTVGHFDPNELAIKDNSTGVLLPTGTVGEIVVRGPSVMPGYINDENSDHTSIEDGWLGTGDLGFVDSDGFLTIVGRIKELINRGGEKISPYDIEKVLHSHASVQEAAAFAVPHPRLGENVAAAVVLRSGALTTAAELKTFLRKHLASSKVPQQILMMPAFPKGATGKVLRSQLSMATSNQVDLFEPPVDPLEIQIADIWRRVLKRTDIGVDEDFFKAGGDSLQAIQVLLEIESLTGQRIPEAELSSALTIRDLVAVVVRGTPKSVESVLCAKQGSGTPYFFCHGDFSTRGFYARKLADLIEGDQPVFLLQPYCDYEGGVKITIEKMAQAYLPQLLKVHPEGRFRLGGFCNGGLLAWELAHQLENAGREVEFVVLCDTISLNARPLIRAYARILEWISRISPGVISNEIRLDWMPKLWRRMSVTLDQENRRFPPELHVVRGAIKRIYRAVIQKRGTIGDRENISNPDDHLVYYRAMANYIPPKIRSMVYCVLCEQSRGTKKFSASVWDHLAREIQVEYVEGAHLTCITTYLDDFSKVTNKILRRTSSAQSRQRRGSSHHVAPQL